MVRRRVAERTEVFRVLLVVLAERTQVDEEAREALRRFYRSAHARAPRRLSGIDVERNLCRKAQRDMRFCPRDDRGVLLRAQVYGSSDIDRLFEVMRASIILLVRELVASGQGQPTLLSLISEPPPSLEPQPGA